MHVHEKEGWSRTIVLLIGVVLPAGVKVSMESPHSSEINEESDNDADYLDEYESEEERRSKRKKKVFNN